MRQKVVDPDDPESVFFIDVPSRWFKSKEIGRKRSWTIFSIWGTSADHDHGKRELEEKYSKVEDYTGFSLGMINWVGLAKEEYDEYREKETVEEVLYPDSNIFGGLPTGGGQYPTHQRVLSEVKYRCSGER